MTGVEKTAEFLESNEYARVRFAGDSGDGMQLNRRRGIRLEDVSAVLRKGYVWETR